MTLQVMPVYTDATGTPLPEDLIEQYDPVYHGRLVEPLGATEAEKAATFWKWAPYLALAVGAAWWWQSQQKEQGR